MTSRNVPWRSGFGAGTAGSSSYQAEKRARSRSTTTPGRVVGASPAAVGMAAHVEKSGRGPRECARGRCEPSRRRAARRSALRRRPRRSARRGGVHQVRADPEVDRDVLAGVDPRRMSRAQVRKRSTQASTVYSCRPIASTTNAARQRSLPSGSIGSRPTRRRAHARAGARRARRGRRRTRRPRRRPVADDALDREAAAVDVRLDALDDDAAPAIAVDHADSGSSGGGGSDDSRSVRGSPAPVSAPAGLRPRLRTTRVADRLRRLVRLRLRLLGWLRGPSGHAPAGRLAGLPGTFRRRDQPVERLALLAT